jgi:hypothetical protein
VGYPDFQAARVCPPVQQNPCAENRHLSSTC